MLGTHQPERPRGSCRWELPFYARVMMVSGQERAIEDKNRLPAHLDATLGPSVTQRHPVSSRGVNHFDTTDLAKCCRERLPPPAHQGPMAPRYVGRPLRRMQCGEGLMVLLFSAVHRARGVRNTDPSKPVSTHRHQTGDARGKETQTLPSLENSWSG